MLIHTDPAQVSKLPHTVLMIGAPVRLDWLFSAVLSRGVYYVEGDLRSKVSTRLGQRQIQAGLVKLEYVGETAKPPVVVIETPQAIEVPREVLTPDSEVTETEPIVILDDSPKKGKKKAKPVAGASADPTLEAYEEDSAAPVSSSTAE